ncbi:MAG: hypothetical protein HW373_1531 [Deltaproteobacteria bacterium]|nr:hypothetical protein [Deltaproteobacteria bacterium]
MDFIIQVLAGLTVAALSALAGYAFRGRRYAKTIKEAPRRYVEHLDRLISEAFDAGSNLARKSSPRATKSVSELTSTTAPCPGDIATPINPSAAMRPPFQKDQIDYEIRKLLAEIGLEKE